MDLIEQVPAVKEIAINDSFILEAHVFKVKAGTTTTEINFRFVDFFGKIVRVPKNTFSSAILSKTRIFQRAVIWSSATTFVPESESVLCASCFKKEKELLLF